MALTACGSDADAAQDAAPRPEPEMVSEAVPESASSPDPAEAPMVPTLTPKDVSLDDPIPARVLRDAVFGMMDQTVAVRGASMGASPLGNGLRISTSASPDFATDPVVECAMGTAPSPVPDGDVTIQGTVASPNLAGQTLLKLVDCSIIDATDSEMTVPALADAVVGWVGTDVAIVGTYNGQTTSTLSGSSKTVVRVQDSGTEGLAEQVASCELSEGVDVPEAVSSDRDGVVFQGTISDLLNWGRRDLTLADCRITNR
ncbi:MAG: hypothetical protein Rubg2KO_33200 [Rubricoccaceae bacterium]